MEEVKEKSSQEEPHHHKIRLLPRRKKKMKIVPGASPGQIVSVPESPKPIIHLLSYSPTGVSENVVAAPDGLKELPPGSIHWINIDGLGDAEVVKRIGELFHLHPLALEDVTSVAARPKIEEYDEFLFIVARMPVQRNGKRISVETEQISIFLLENTVITFQEVPGGDPFEKIRERIKKSKGKIRSRGPDYLTYALIDAIIDSYYPILDERSDDIEHVEAEILKEPKTGTLSRLHMLKQELILVRRALWPIREVVNSLIRDSSDRVCDETKLFLRDCYDHSSQLLDLSETYRELCSDLMDIYLSNISNKMNEVMKFLTIISTIFIPLTFIVGVYGMNFNPESSPWNMPELTAYYGYPAVLGVMVLLSFCLIVFFRRKGWL